MARGIIKSGGRISDPDETYAALRQAFDQLRSNDPAMSMSTEKLAVKASTLWPLSKDGFRSFIKRRLTAEQRSRLGLTASGKRAAP